MSDHIERNREIWNRTSADYQQRHGPQLSVDEPGWGVWQIPESRLHVLGDVRGRDVLELGCGGAQWAVGLALRGARVTGLDLSREQLRAAAALAASRGAELRLVEADAEATGLPDASFDVVFCDHGAMSFADPHRTVPEVARLLRPGALFAFAHTSPLVSICFDAARDRLGETLRQSYFGLHRISDSDGVYFNLPMGEWIALFRRCGLAVEDLLELRPDEGATTTYELVSLDWARRWPAEQIWRLRKREG